MKVLLKRTIFSTFLLVIVFNSKPVVSFNSTEIWNGFSKSCDSEDPQRMSLSCHGIRIIRKVVQQLLVQSASRRKIEIFNGITLTENEDVTHKSRSNGVGSILNFLESRELRIKLSNLLPDTVEPALNQTLKDVATARAKGGKKGGGTMMAVALMCKMLAALGFGALGLLAMKALMTSALALMLSLIIAAKKFGGHHHHEDLAHVIYAQESHHHRKRSLDSVKDAPFSPYKGYVHYAKLSAST